MIDSRYQVFRRTGDEVHHDAYVLYDGRLWQVQEPFIQPTRIMLARRDHTGKASIKHVHAVDIDVEIVHIVTGNTMVGLATVEQHERGNNVPIIASVEHPDHTTTMELAYIGGRPVIVFSYTDALAQILEFTSDQQAQEHYRTIANLWHHSHD
jgi:hypothetical protein